jgi:hypothetical protein
LRDAVVVAQVDEQEGSMIPLAMHPARQLDGLADVFGTKDGAGVRTIAVRGHKWFKGFKKFEEFMRASG